MKGIRKRLGILVLALFLLVSVTGGRTGVGWIDQSMVQDVMAASQTVKLSKILSKCKIEEIGRPEAEGLWSMRVGGKKVFCLHPGKSLHTGDSASGKASDAANYKNQSLAKVLTYYFGIKKQQGGTKLYGLCQAYAWAAGKGVNKKTAMVQAAGYCGASESYAKRVYEEISHTAPYGEVIYYTVNHCKKSSGKTHQHLIGWRDKKDQPEYAAVEESYEGKEAEQIKIRILKTDAETKKPLDKAVFDIYRDGVKVQTVTTVNGEANWTYTASYTVEVKPEKEYTYVTNWNVLSRTQQEAEKKKGYYSSEAAALAAWKSDMKPKADALLQARKEARHVWKVVEVTTPKNHQTADAQEQTEEEDTTELTYSFTDRAVKMTLHLKKKATGDCGVEASLKGAVYGLYADEILYGTDNATAVWKKGDLAATLTVDEEGNASVKDLIPGLYVLKELQAPEGFVKDETVYPTDLRWQLKEQTVERTAVVEDRPIRGRIHIKKTFDGNDVPLQMVEEKKLKLGYVAGICEHHREHTKDCGYEASVEEKSCTHVHTDACYKEVLTCEMEETEAHAHTAACYDSSENLICGKAETEAHQHDTACYEKKLQCGHTHTADCGYAEAQAGHPCTYICPVCAYEIVWTEKEIPITDVFALFDAKGEKVSEVSIAQEGEQKGTGTSAYLPYGTYTLQQVSSTEHFADVPVQTVTIAEDEQYIELELDDKREETAFFITKLKTIADAETGVYKKEAEVDAEFELYAPDGRLVRTVKTDKNGTAYSGNLDLYGTGTYTVKQISGAADYKILAPQQLEVELEKTVYTAVYENTYCGSKIRIQKYMEKAEKKEPEPGAEFAILDADLIKETKEELTAMRTAGERTGYVLELKKTQPEAILGTLLTNEKGQAVTLLETWVYENHPKGFLVLQTNGEEGYQLSDPVWSSEMKMQVEEGVHVFSFEAVDQWEDWADLVLIKKMTASATDTVPEAGAVFGLVDSKGQTVDTQTADEKGCVQFKNVMFGSYTIEQISGDERHEWMQPVSVTLTQKDRHQTVEAAPAVTDSEKKITFELTKTSSETDIPVNGARYQLYRIEADETAENGWREEFVANFVTGTAVDPADGQTQLPGKAVYCLPYGTYLLREVHPADGYTLDETEYRFVLDMDSVVYDKNGDGTYGLTVTDDPVTGTITIEKTGNILVGYDGTSQTFQSENDGLAGAEYTLYARENITQDDGTILYVAGTRIDRKVTDASGNARFTRLDKNGQVTDRFYLGKYYVKETAAPDGYVLDETEHDIVLDWDNKTDQFEDLRELPATAETENPIGTEEEDPESGRYILAEGQKVNKILQRAKQVVFTWEKAPDGTAVHAISSDGSDGIVWWSTEDTCYISTQKAGQVIYLHPQSDHMFAGCSALEEIRFKNTDTALVTDMNHMFYRCGQLTKLDLSSFNTANTEDMSCMFAFCPLLEKIRVNDQKLEKELVFEEDIPVRMIALPKTTFAVGHAFRADEFLYYLLYTNGKSEKVDASAGVAGVSPRLADVAGQKTVQISFGADSRYGKFGTVDAEVTVMDPSTELQLTWQQPEVTLPLTDEDQKISIQIVKSDQEDEKKAMLAGAEFTLYAACDIVNRKGEVILKKDSEIARQVSGNDTFSYVEFINLPSAAYKKDAAEPYMYYIRETKSPDGYYGTDKTVWCTGKAAGKITWETIYGWEQTESTESEQKFMENEEYLFTNKKIPYLILKKEWLGDARTERPAVLTVTVMLPDGSRRQFTLKQAADWTLITDIDASLFQGYTTEEMQKLMKENLPDGYVHGQDIWEKENNTYTFVNQAETTESRVEKVWEDGSDRDGLRPSTVRMTLYAEDQPLKTVTLPDANGVWAYTEKNLPVTDETGHVIRYSWKEEPSEQVSGDMETDYLSVARVDGADPKLTVVKNIHSYDAGMSVTIHKKMNLKNSSFFAGPLVFTFTVSGTDSAGRPQDFVQTVTFTEKDLETADKNGEVTKTITFAEIPCGTYTVTESGMEGLCRKVSVTPGKNAVLEADGTVRIHTEPGYTKAWSEENGNEPQQAEVTFENEVVRGRILVTKYKDDKKHPLAGVTFRLQDLEGKTVQSLTTAADGTVSFDDLLPGEYILTETKTVNGCALLKDPVKIRLPYTITEEDAARQGTDVTDGVLYNGTWYLYQLAYSVTDHAVLSLPMTGYMSRYRDLLLPFAAVGLLGLGIFGVQRQKKRRRHLMIAEDERAV